MRALKTEVVRIASGFDLKTGEMVIYVDCLNVGSYKVSIQFFYDISLSELWVLRQKVRTSSELGILLHEKLI